MMLLQCRRDSNMSSTMQCVHHECFTVALANQGCKVLQYLFSASPDTVLPTVPLPQ